MSREAIVLVGAGGHAVACIDVIEREGRFQIRGLVGRVDEIGQRVLGHRVIASDADLASVFAEGRAALITVGQIKTADVRRSLYQLVLDAGGELPTIVSPSAYVSPHAQLGAGTIVMHGAIVNAGARIGANCIINTRALVEHGCEVGDHCHVSTAAVLNGDVRVGTGCFIGSASSVRQSLTIGDDCVIGMGQVVLKDCTSGTRLPAVAAHA